MTSLARRDVIIKLLTKYTRLLIAGVMGKVSVDDKMRIETLREQGLARSRRNAQRRTGSWTLLSSTVNASMKLDQLLSQENQSEVDTDRFVRQR